MIKFLSAVKEELQSYCNTYFLLENFNSTLQAYVCGSQINFLCQTRNKCKGCYTEKCHEYAEVPYP